MNKGYIRLRTATYLYVYLINKVSAFSLNMSVVYAYMLIDSISGVYTYVLCTVYCVLWQCRLDVFKVIRFDIEVKDV
jgi:hypothetical protein